MKKLFFILSVICLLVTQQTKASEAGKFFLYGWGIGAVVTPLFYSFPMSWPANENGLYISSGIDPGILLYDKDLDYRIKIIGHYNKYELSTTYEDYSEIKYKSQSVALNYLIVDRACQLYAGPEYTRIHNKNDKNLHKVNSIGVNLEVRMHISPRISLSYIHNLKTRPELTKSVVFSGYFHINYLINKP